MSKPLRCAIEVDLPRFRLDLRFESSHAITGVFGPSGAGKTTLLECVIGVRHDARGVVALGDSIWLDSARGVFVAPEDRGVGYVPQAGLLFPHLTARENVRTGRRRARRRGIDVDRIEQTAIEVLELGAVLDQPASSLSGGERQRVALARAIASAPSLLVLDEPLASLDVALRHRLLPYVKRIRDEFRIPMLLVSHSPVEVETLCDHVLAVREGRVVDRGEPGRVLAGMHLRHGGLGESLRSIVVVSLEGTKDGRSHGRLVGTDVALVVRVPDPATNGPRGGREVLVGIPADSVVIAMERPQAISAANVLAAEVCRIDRGESSAIVHLTLAEKAPTLLAELALASVGRLGIEVGSRVHAVIKASSCEVLGPA